MTNFFPSLRILIPNKARVLLVDDDKNFCANMKDILSDKGYRMKDDKKTKDELMNELVVLYGRTTVRGLARKRFSPMKNWR